MLLKARTIRTGVDLGPARVAVQRPDPFKGPTKLYMAYIEDGWAKVATSLMVDRIPTQWDYEYSLATAIDVAIEFDGRWERIPGGQHAPYTVGSPFVAIVRPFGRLTVQRGQLDTPFELAADGVSRVAMLRGWKNTYLWNHDQGVIIAYIRNGVVCYRNYAQQPPDLPAIWEPERIVTELPTPTQNIALFRTNDYRVGIICESNGRLYWTITTRNWALMAIEQHTIGAAITLETELISLTYTDIYNDLHTITGVIGLELLTLYGAAYNNIVTIYNEDNETIHIFFEHQITELVAEDFQVYDENDDLFDVTGLAADSEDPLHFVLTTLDLNHSVEGDLTLKFLGGGRGEADQLFDPFNTVFTPTGLEYEEVSGPEVEAIWNE